MTANADLDIHRAVQEIIEMLHFASDKEMDTTYSSLKLHIKTVGIEEENEKCLFHLKLHSSLTSPEEFLPYLTQTQDSALLCVLSAMQVTEDESHLSIQYIMSPGVITQQSFQVQHSEDQSQLVLHCISTSTKSSKKTRGVTLHLRILNPKHRMMLECQKMYRYLWLFKIFNPKVQVEFYMKIFENLCESDFSCRPIDLTGVSLEMCGDTSYFLRNTSYECTAPCLAPVCSEIALLPLCERTGDSSYPTSVSLQVVAHMDFIQRGGGGKCRNSTTQGLIKLYLFGPGAVPVFPVIEDTDVQYNPLEQIPWNIYGLKFHPSSTSIDKLCAWLRKKYPSILKDHQMELEKCISQVMACLLKPTRETDKKSDCYTKAIPYMVKSIGYILSHSSNERFRQHCLSLLSINNSQIVESEVTNRLWDIASKKCGVRGHTEAGGPYGETNPSNHKVSTGISLTDLGKQTSSESTDIKMEETFIDDACFTEERHDMESFAETQHETITRSSYKDLGEELFKSHFMAQDQKSSSTELKFPDKEQETISMSSFADFENKVCIVSDFTNRRQDVDTCREQDSFVENINCSGFTFIGQGHPTECGSRKNTFDITAGYDFTVDQKLVAPAGSRIEGPEENSADSVLPEFSSTTESDFITQSLCLHPSDNSSWTEITGESIQQANTCNSLNYPLLPSSQVSTRSTPGRVYDDYWSCCNDKSRQKSVMSPVPDTGIGPAGDVFNYYSYHSYNINNSCNTGVASQNQSAADTDYLPVHDSGKTEVLDHLNNLTCQDGKNYSIKGNDYGGLDHEISAGNSFDDVLVNVQQWLDEF